MRVRSQVKALTMNLNDDGRLDDSWKRPANGSGMKSKLAAFQRFAKCLSNTGE